jgi:glutamine amidotransferase
VRVALLDYRAGNLTSVRKALAAVGAVVFDPGAPAALAGAAAVVVPGVGHFGATRMLGEDWRDAVRLAVDEGRPVLGICLGMQWLFDGSDEAPDLPGLGLFRGRCTRLGGGLAAAEPPSGGTGAGPIKVPHVGWNDLELVGRSPLVAGIASGAQAYFTHSYAAPLVCGTVAVTGHGERFASVVAREHVFGVQFHPEKSGEVGLTILGNFMAVARGRAGARAPDDPAGS